MFNLIQNETIKLAKRKLSWILPLLIIFGMFFVAFMQQRSNNSWQEYLANNPDQENYEFRGGQRAYQLPDGQVVTEEEFWQQEEPDHDKTKMVTLTVAETITELNKQLAKMDRITKPTQDDFYRIRSLKSEIAYYEAYEKSGQLPPDSRKGQTSAQFFSDFGGLYLIPTLIIVVIASLMIATEFSSGTIKLLLTRPYSRTQILFSKYFVTMLYSGFLSVVMVGSAFVFSKLLPAQSLMLPLNSETGSTSALTIAVSLLGTNFLLMIFYMTVAFFFSAVFRSQAAAVGVGMLFLFSGSILGQILPTFIEKYPWLKWIIFNLLNLNGRVLNSAYTVGGNLSISAMVVGLIAYIIVILIATVVLFNKRDVALS